MENKNTINRIVSLRGIAVLGVVFMHLLAFTTGETNALVEFIYKTGRHGVLVFFTISGFILPYSLRQYQYQHKNFFSFLLKRSIRIDPPYWCAIFLLFVLCNLPTSLLTIQSVFLHLTYLVPFFDSVKWFDGVYWTLSVEFQFYILLGLCYPLLIKASANLTLLILALLSALFIGNNSYGLIISDFYPFVFGYFTFMAYTKQVEVKRIVVVMLLLAVFIVFFKSTLAGLVPLATALIILLVKDNRKIPGLHFIGQTSYSIYLLHIPITVFLVKLLSAQLAKGMPLFLICLFATILFSYLFFLIIEKPSIRLSKKISLKP